jgi:hypothetical protein
MEHLPDDAQAIIFPLASTPSCPAHVLLARVSKLWGAAALQHFREEGAGISLKLACTADSTKMEMLQELGRLKALATWLQKQGHALTSFNIQHSIPPGRYLPGHGPGMSSILEALAAAGKQPGGLRLEQLQVPAVGPATPASLTRALSGCHQLRELQLDPDCGQGRMGVDGYLDRDLCIALWQCSQLTALRLYAGSDTGTSSPARLLNDLFMCLPRSLVVLDMGTRARCFLNTICLEQLVALKQLTLPYKLLLIDSSLGRALTALTHLDCPAMAHGQQLLAAVPNLVELHTFQAPAERLTGLSTHTALRSLACVMEAAKSAAGCNALAQLTQLTALKLRLSPALHGVAAAHLVAWGAALSSMTGLRSLALQPYLLERVNLAALTSLTRLEVNLRGTGVSWYGKWYRSKLLSVLSPAHGRLQEVVLVGVPAAEQELFRSAAGTAALGAAAVSFCDTCGRRVWCVCCH